MKQLHVFTLATTAESFFDGEFGYLADNGHEITVVANSQANEIFCRRNKIKAKQLAIARAIAPIADLRSIKAIIKEIKENNYDVVVGHTPKGAMIAMLASLLAGTKKRIYFRHGLVYTTATGFKRVILKAVERLTALCATDIINVSPSLSKLAVKEHLNSNSKQTVFLKGTCGGIDTKKLFNPALIDPATLQRRRHELGLTDNDFVIGFCGRLCPDKGIAELLDGFVIFKQRNPHIPAKLLMVGGFDQRDILCESVKNRINHSPDILHTGSIAHELLPEYYSLMDVFVFPSYREGFGMSVIEASAMQVPILVSRSHGCVDSIVEGLTGEYIDLDAHSVATGIESMLDHAKRTRYGAAGRKWVADNFDHNIIWPHILAFFNSLNQKK